MAQNDKPVIVTLSCEATPQTATEEIDRAEWDAMTPNERARMLTDMAVDHINNSGGGGWWIDDPEDSAAADAVGGDPEPDPCRELAEWLADMHDPAGLDAPRAALAEIRARAREALGRTEEG